MYSNQINYNVGLEELVPGIFTINNNFYNNVVYQNNIMYRNWTGTLTYDKINNDLFTHTGNINGDIIMNDWIWYNKMNN